MTEVRNIIARGRTLTGRKLRQAIEAATGTVVGGRGIKVVTMNNKSVISLKGHPIIGGGGGAGAAFPGLVTAVIDSGAAPYNAFYEVKALDGSLMPPIVGPRFVVPHFRPFNTDFVDMEAALEKDFVSILAMGPLPLTQPDPPDGCCLDLISGSVEFVDQIACSGIDQFFFGDGMPCAIFDIAENVKISLCPEQPPASVGPPPRVFANPGLLT